MLQVIAAPGACWQIWRLRKHLQVLLATAVVLLMYTGWSPDMLYYPYPDWLLLPRPLAGLMDFCCHYLSCYEQGSLLYSVLPSWHATAAAAAVSVAWPTTASRCALSCCSALCNCQDPCHVCVHCYSYRHVVMLCCYCAPLHVCCCLQLHALLLFLAAVAQ